MWYSTLRMVSDTVAKKCARLAQSVRAAIDVAGAQVLGLRTETEVLRSPFAKQVEQIDEEMVSVGDDPERSVVASSQMDALKKVLADLPEELRVVWVLREIGARA